MKNINNLKESENIIKYRVTSKGLSVKKVLLDNLGISTRLFRKLSKNKLIFLNNKKVKPGQLTNKGDTITIIMKDEDQNIKPQNIPLDIIYEDYDLLILNKQPYMVVYPTKSHKDNTIANGIAYYFNQKGINKKIRFVNRLDMNTSGILVVAKNSFGHQQMSRQFENNIVEKKYITIVKGRLKKEKGLINKPIGIDDDNPIRRKVKDEGKEAVTKYKVIEKYKDASLVEVKIETGRTHQIRVHLSSIGHPIIGDTLYNEETELIKRQALHSYSLKFKIPRTGKQKEVIAKIPNDMKRLIKLLK
ncbi:RluA family pseudouridine synthase [Thermohalobacter berrensis]|uniref:Pseudouridine synthase n=1 Tax=Thermohalobacter berrensis TaxID=99594 RepID=A0A419T1M8_9FIRM|nr:RluA family pseudouridine synthase [Thermohalobacter berrensis]RKD31464.1 RNA pseudouridine synthase [Thermohalobacter berrensis]